MDEAAHPSPSPAANPTNPVQGTLIEHYKVVDRVGRGGTAWVYEVVDVDTDARAALKLLHGTSHAPAQRSRFRREFRSLSRLRHPNVLEVYEWGEWHERPWYSMELVEGEDLRDAIQRWQTLEPEARFTEVRNVLVQVTRALAYIHGRGLVHRDVSPGNILIRSSDGVVKLMDFGLVTDRETELTRAGEVMGTAAYIAPEQIKGESTDSRADLYALGTVLYQMLTGRKPFSAHTVQGYMEKHLHEIPRSPSEIDPLVPEDLSEITMRLLRKDPTRRFASAVHLLHVLGETEGGDEGRWPPRTVGRLSLTRHAQHVFDRISHDRPGEAILLHGPSGYGKSRVMDIIEQEANRRGLVVARARCLPDSPPFGAFEAIYRTLSRHAEPSEVLTETFEQQFLGERRERYPVLSAFRELVSATAPCVLLLDDVDKADSASLELLAYLIRNTLGDESVAYIMAANTIGADLVLPEVSTLQRVPIRPLNRSEVEDLVMSVVPDAPAANALAQRLFEETDGSPALIADMLRGLVDDGVLTQAGDRWTLELAPDEISRSQLPLPASLRQVLAERIEPLSDEAIHVGRIVATARGALSLDALLEIADADEDDVMAALDELLDAHIVREKRIDGEDHVELSHQRFGDILLGPLSDADRRSRHRAMGEVLERQYRYSLASVVEDLAYHFEQAKVAPKAYAYLLQTAQRHLRRSLFDEGLNYLDRCLRMEPEARPYMRLEVADRLLTEVALSKARALHHLGRWQEAMTQAQRACALADTVRDPRLQSRAYGMWGNQLRGIGQIDAAEGPIRQALDHARAADDRSLTTKPLYDLGAIEWSRGHLGVAENLWKESLGVAQALHDQRGEALAYNGLGILAMCEGKAAEARRRLENSADLFERIGMIEALAVTRVNLVELYMAIGVLRKAMALADRTVAQAREVQHIHGIAMGLVWRSRLLWVLGKPDEARRNALQALRMSRALGTPEEQILSLLTLVRVMLGMGMATFARARVEELLHLLHEADYEGKRIQIEALMARVCVASDSPEDIDPSWLENVPDDGYPLTNVRTLLEVGQAQAAMGRTQEAIDAFQKAHDRSREYSFRYYQLSALHHLSQTVTDPTLRETHARKAKSMARSIASTLPRELKDPFLSRGWGVPR